MIVTRLMVALNAQQFRQSRGQNAADPLGDFHHRRRAVKGCNQLKSSCVIDRGSPRGWGCPRHEKSVRSSYLLPPQPWMALGSAWVLLRYIFY